MSKNKIRKSSVPKKVRIKKPNESGWLILIKWTCGLNIFGYYFLCYIILQC